ncbi:MAG TPA: site-specific integrase, partial [Methylomirabilota bacterium]
MKDPLAAFFGYLEVEKHASPHTVKSYRGDLGDFLRWLGGGAVRDVNARDVRAFLAVLHTRGLDPVSVARKL